MSGRPRARAICFEAYAFLWWQVVDVAAQRELARQLRNSGYPRLIGNSPGSCVNFGPDFGSSKGPAAPALPGKRSALRS
eukprot:3952911-Alexandrium_andersonii.AAC.1